IDLALSVDNYASAEEGIEKVTEIAESAGINLENITFDNGTAQKFIEISETEIEILKSYEIAREEAERTSMLAQAEETGNYRRFIPTTDPAKAPMQEGGMILLGESLRLGQYLVWNGNDLCPEFLKTADLGKLKELLSDYQKAIDKARMLLEDAGFLPVDILTSRYRDDLLIYGTVIVHQYIKDNFLAQVLEEEKRREEMGE
ncbi:MAG: hypothetical protein FWH20_11360, partial [Oscillospiraceae bacterium]|nr:hypothetical protein [Oscillospiraceae bacterium]